MLVLKAIGMRKLLEFGKNTMTNQGLQIKFRIENETTTCSVDVFCFQLKQGEASEGTATGNEGEPSHPPANHGAAARVQRQAVGRYLGRGTEVH